MACGAASFQIWRTEAQRLADHDAAEDDVDQQSGQCREHRDGGRANQAPAIGYFPEEPRSGQQDQKAGNNTRRNVDSGQPGDDAAQKHAADERHPEHQETRTPPTAKR